MTALARAFLGLAACGALVACFSERSAVGPDDDQLCDSTAPNLVKIRNFAFSPAQLTVAPGTTVTWVNCDDVQHSATSDTPRWDSGLLSRNASYRTTFAAAGTFPYHCEPHPTMRASIVVR